MEGFFVGKYVNKKTITMKSHFHNNYYEIYYLKHGNMRYIISDKIYELSKGDVAFIPKGVIHNTVYNELKSERLLINFSGNFVSDPALLECFNRGVISLSEKECFEFESIFKKMEAEEANKDVYSKRLATQYVTELLISFARKEKIDAPKELDGYNRIMQEAAEYINSSYETDISLPTLSKKFSLSQSFFSRKFKEVTGFGVAEYINLVRIKMAEKLLKEGRLSMTEVAYACGFSDSSYFAMTFKKLMGTTPLKYAKRYR